MLGLVGRLGLFWCEFFCQEGRFGLVFFGRGEGDGLIWFIQARNFFCIAALNIWRAGNSALLVNLQGISINMEIESRLWFVKFNAWQRKFKPKRLYIGRDFHKVVCSIVVYLLCFLKIEKDIMVLSDNFDLLNKLKFLQIFQYLRQFSR